MPVSVTSPSVSAGLAVLLLLSVARAFLGPPAARPRRRLAGGLLGVTAGCYVAGAALAALAGAPGAGAVLVVAGIEVSCLGAWLVRAGDDPPGEDDDEPSPWDWDAFDRARATWGRRPAGPRAEVG